MSRRGYSVQVLGPISIDHPQAKQRSSLSQAKQRLIAALVMAGDNGVAWYTLRAEDEPVHDEESVRAAFRMGVSRLRAHLPPGSIEDIGEGALRLTLATSDVDAWHLLDLATTDDALDDVATADLLHLLQPVEPFGIVGIDGMFEAAARRIYDARHDLMLRIAKERPELLRGEFVFYLRGHLREDPFNERLLATLVMAEAHGGDRRRALRTLRAARDEFIEIGLELSAEVAALEDDLLDPDAQSRFEPLVPQLLPPIPVPLRDLRIGHHVGHRDELVELEALVKEGSGQALVHGPSGVGKSRLCAELAHRVSKVRVPTIYLRPEPQGSDAAFAPLLRSLPSFRDRALPVLAQPASPETRTVLLVMALQELAERAGDGVLLLIVDDSQLLDSATAELVRQLPSTDVAAHVVLVVVATDSGDDESPMAPAVAVADSAVAKKIEVGPLGETELRDMVRSRWPDNLEPLVWNVAQQLHQMSGGRAGVASILLASIPEADMLPDLGELRGVRPIAQIADALPPEVARIGAAASVLGQRFDLHALAAVTGLSHDELLGGLDELLRRQLVRETKGLHYEVVHAIVAKALLDTASAERLCQWHELAARHYRDDLHRRALHGFAAGDLLPRAEVFEALRASALEHLSAGSYWEAVVIFRKALLLFEDGRLDLVLEGSFARALELVGLRAEAARVRERALADALARDDHATGLSITVSGLPEAQLVDGDRILVDRLDRIDAAKLDPALALELACHRSRQLSILGEYEEATRRAAEAVALATEPAGRIMAVFTQRFALACTSEPDDRCKLLDGVEGEVAQADSAVKAEYYILQALDCYAAGRTATAVEWRERLDELADPPLIRQWHGMQFDAMRTWDEGRLTEAAARRAEAVSFGLLAGINGATESRDASLLIDMYLTTGFGSFADSVGDVVGPGRILDPDASTLQCSGAAVVLLDCGLVEEAVALAEGLATAVTRSPVGERTVALAFAAEALALSTRSDLVDDVRRLLERRGRSSMVLGAAVASLGPVANYLATLAPDDGQRRKHLEEAVAVAADAGQTLWQVYCQARLARLIDDQAELDRLRNDYADSELLPFIDRP